MSVKGDPRSPTQRFSDRVDDYVRHRPGYPREVFDYLRKEAGLGHGSVVADIGSGSGAFSRGLLEAGASVRGVEPNEAMRAAAERLLAGFSGFRSIAGSAEATGLATASVDAVTAAQAFHWFRLEETRVELGRVLRPGGQLVLVWNRRLSEGSRFARDYEALLVAHATDYREVDHRRTQRAEVFARVFAAGWREARFATDQELDWDGLVGRLFSSSYVPGRDRPEHRPMLEGLRLIFDACQRGGRVRMEYETELYHGLLDPAAD
jgi:SAM-dependent methyltransferase